MNRLSLAALPLLLIAAGARADVQIEERSLSGSAPAVAAKTTTAAPAAAAPGGAASAGGNAMWDQYTQLQQLQQQLGQLQGMVEQQGFLIEKLQNDLRVRYTDLDQRLTAQQEMQKQQPATGSALPVMPGGADTPGAAPSATFEEEQKAYASAIGMYKSGGADKAIPPMLAFVKRYPGSSLTPGAYYFLGEFHLGAHVPDYDAALRQFNTVVTEYPNHPKAPAALYQIGAILDMQHKPQEARARMLELKQKYPQSEEAAKADSYLQALEAAKAPPAPEKPATKPTGKTAAAKAKPATKVSKVSKKN